MDLGAELRQLEEEFGFGVRHVGPSQWQGTHGVPDERAYVAITTLEGSHLCVELSARGFQVMGEGEDATLTEAQFLGMQRGAATKDSGRCYETMQALLMAESPLYRQAFHARLLSQLSATFPSSP